MTVQPADDWQQNADVALTLLLMPVGLLADRCFIHPRTVRATIGDRAFPSAAASVWNSLPEPVRGSPTLPVFRNRLKTELFARSFS